MKCFYRSAVVRGWNFLCSTGCWRALCCPRSKPWSCIVYLENTVVFWCPQTETVNPSGSWWAFQVMSQPDLKRCFLIPDWGYLASASRSCFGRWLCSLVKRIQIQCTISRQDSCHGKLCKHFIFIFPSPPVPRKLPQSAGLKTSPVLRPIYKKHCPVCWCAPMNFHAWEMLQNPDAFHCITHKHQIHLRH